MKKSQKRIVSMAAVLALTLGMIPMASAMHIMEGYLPPSYCILWGALCLPFLAAGWFSIRKRLQENPRSMTVLAISGAFIFVLSSLKIPSVTGSCSHMTGTGLAAILFGAGTVSVLGIVVLIFQATLLAHGGITTLGANTFSMAIAGPIVTVLVYKLCNALKVNKHVGVFLAAAVGDLFTYCVTSVQLALAYPSAQGGVLGSAMKFLAVFAPTQLPLAIIEGVLTVLIVMGLETYAKPELREIGYVKVG